MKIFITTEGVRAWSRSERAAGRRVGFVPTMGCLHEGHLSLVALAKQRAASVVTSIFVNPTQFGPGEDFDKYPRTQARDFVLLETAGCDAVFIPSTETMYPPGASSAVEEKALSANHDGASRPGHFRGVCTVVAKLFNIVEPDCAVFGRKDYQQAAIIRRMTRDLDFPVEIITAPIVREADGLAMSSRNNYLTPDERARALVLSRALDAAQKAAAQTPGIAVAELAPRLATMISEAGLKPDYVVFADAETLEPVVAAHPGAVLLLAAWCGKTRLIDNCVLI